jgi:hypothetical protein
MQCRQKYDYGYWYRLQVLLGINVNAGEYNNFKTSVKDSIDLAERKKIPVATDNKARTLNVFVTRFKKGSRQVRNVITQNIEAKLKCSAKTSTKTFFRLIALNVLPESDLENGNMLWSLNCLPNKIREFIYKFNNNSLG